MNGRQASRASRRLSEAVLGGMAGLGARVLLAGAARLLGFKQGPVAVVGGVAGVAGALVGGRLARRQHRLEPVEPRRGHNGRERPEYFQQGSRHTA